MMRITSILVLGFIWAGVAKEIIGYYPSWQWYDRAQKVKPSTIPYEKLTIINFAFFHPDDNGNLKGTDDWADINILKGENDWTNGGYKPNTSLIDLAHNNNVKVLVSLGGWTLSDKFPAIAASPALTENFATSCIELIQEYGFDGIDVDWEYPGLEEHNGTPADKVNFTKFLQAIRNKLDTYGAGTGKEYLLTAALPAGPEKVANIEVEKVGTILDMLNIMTYDFFGSWDPTSNHNSPLYAPEQGDPSFNLEAAFKLYHETHGVPAHKINLGAAFYGRSFAGATELFGVHTGVDNTFFTPDEGIPTYYNIMAAVGQGGWVRNWDETAQVPYLTNASSKVLVSYDDEESIGLKAGYVNDHGAAGLIIWEITGDFMEDGSTPLLDKVNEVFNTGVPIERSLPTHQHRFQVRRMGGSIELHFRNGNKNQVVEVNLLNMKGEKIESLFSGVLSQNRLLLNLVADKLNRGVYFLEVQHGETESEILKVMPGL